MTIYIKCPDCLSYTAIEADSSTWTRCVCGAIEYQYPIEYQSPVESGLMILNMRRVPPAAEPRGTTAWAGSPVPDAPAARMNHYRCPVCETDVRLTPDLPYAVCPCGVVHMERQERQTAIYLRHNAYSVPVPAPDPPTPIATAVLAEQAAALVRLETDLLLARSRIKKLEQAQAAEQAPAGASCTGALTALQNRADAQEQAITRLGKQIVRLDEALIALRYRVAALEARTAVPRVDVVVCQGEGA